MSLLRLFDDLFSRDQDHYRHAASLDGHRGPINTLSANTNGTLIASGGDDEEVRIWDIDRLRCCQIITDPARQWGQITAVKFLKLEITTVGSEWLCFGTGRGQFILYRKPRKTAEFVECLSTRVFSAGDGVEAFAFDHFFQRFAITSHYGRVKMFSFRKGDLVELWSDELLDAIPRAIFFTEKGQDVTIYGMENGTAYSRDAETSNAKSTRVFKTPTGNISSHTTAGILIDNMRDGFDLYVPNRTAPLRSFKVHSTRKFVKGCVFGEDGKIAVCGSDHGKVYVFGVQDEEWNQTLVHGARGQMIQSVQTATNNGYHFIVSGASEGKCDIAIWRRPIRARVRESEKSDIPSIRLIFNLILVTIFAWATHGFWLSPIQDSVIFMENSRANLGRSAFEKEMPSIDQILNSLDDATLRRLLGVSPAFDMTNRFERVEIVREEDLL